MTSAIAYQEETVDVRGSKVRLLRAGKGEPFLWLHGANGGGWNPFLEKMSSFFEVLAPDHPGFGQSERGDWVDSVDDLAFHYRDLLDVLGFERVYICGNSIGAWIGLQFALIQSHRVKKLIVCNAAGTHIPGKEGPDLFMYSLPQLMELCFYDKTKMPKVPQPNEISLEVHRNRAMFARLAWEKGYDPKLLHRLQGLKTPTLIVWGKEDRLIPVENGERLHRTIPGSAFSVIEQCGHLPYAEKTEELKEKIIQFINHSCD